VYFCQIKAMRYQLANFVYFQFFLIAILIANLATSCNSQGSDNAESDTILKKIVTPKLKTSKLLVFPNVFDSLVGWEFKNDSVPVWDNMFFDYDREHLSNILTFRGGYQRNSPVIGILPFIPKSLKLAWDFQTNVDTLTGKYGYWGGGAGWTGQPLLLNWTANECKSIETLYDDYRNRRKELNEIVQISLSGYIYFIDLETGEKTRDPIYISNPIKGTPSIDPQKQFLLVGQGVPHRGGFHWRCFNLRSCKLIHEEKTPSSFAFKGWGASDASPIFTGDAKFIWPSESGVVYFGQVTSNGVNQLSEARYRITNPSRQGIESSPSAIANLVYMADNGGTVFCLDVRTMKPRWHYTTGDDNDATPVVEVINGVPYVYIGNEVDMQGKRGTASFSKLNGLTGQLIWKYSRKCNSEFGKKPNSGGILSTCCIGKGKIESYVWTVFSRVDSMLSGKLVCINKETGKLKYEINMRQYSWVSPILLYDRLGNAYLYLSDVGGNVYLILAETGEILYKKNIGMTFESSPIAWNNFIIQPARGNQILCFQLE